MHSVKQKFGTWFLLMLYCLTIASVLIAPADFFSQQAQSLISEECKSADSFDHFDHTSQWDLQLKSIKEKSEFSGCNKFHQEIDHLASFGFISIKKIETSGISNEKETFPFSGADIIFPFHNFW